ncbi:MAG: SAP domain-containing protein [Syntrophales bacterium]
MKMQEIRVIAKKMGVNIKVGRSKNEIIRDIQIKEGNSPCYGTKDECEYNCLWKPDCLSDN